MTTQRYALLAAVGAVYAVVTSMLVGFEGGSYRKSLGEARAKKAVPVVVTPGPTDSRAGGASPLSPDGDLRPERRAGGVSPLPSTPEQDRGLTPPARQETPPARQETPPARQSVEPTNPPEVAFNVPAPKPVTIPKAEPAQRSAAASWSDSLDLAAITPEQEMRLGGELNRIVLATTPVDRDGDVQRLRKSADPLLKFRTRPEIDYTFAILDSDAVNAFSLPGGFIYVSKGLFNLVGQDMEPEQDYALQFALGHEIAHIDLKHTLKLLAPGNAAAKKQGVDTLHQCLVPVMVAYPNTMEFEADDWAYQRMTHGLEPSRTQREAWMFLIKFEGFAKKNGFRNGRMSLDPTSGMTLVENHHRAHPAAWERLDRLKALSVHPAAPNGAKPR